MVNARAFFVDARERRAMRVVELFFAAFTEGRLDAARRLCTRELTWFGRAIDAAGWSTPRARTFHREAKMTFTKLRSIPDALLSALKSTFDQDHLFEGPVTPPTLIVLIDVTIAGQQVTVGAVVEDIDSDPQIARIFDPAALRTGLERLGNSIS